MEPAPSKAGFGHTLEDFTAIRPEICLRLGRCGHLRIQEYFKSLDSTEVHQRAVSSRFACFSVPIVLPRIGGMIGLASWH